MNREVFSRRLTCSACGAVVPGTIGGRCPECNDEDAAIAALEAATERLRAMVAERRDAVRCREDAERGYRRWLAREAPVTAHQSAATGPVDKP